MRKFYPIALLAIMTAAEPAAAQQFVNGDLEANSPCGTQVRNFQFNTFLYGAGYAFGTTLGAAGYNGEIYISQTSGPGCVEGPAQKGSYFLGLISYTSGLVDAMSLKLDAPLQANKTYTLTFYTKMSKNVSPSIASIPLQIGYTTDSLKFGTLVTTVDAPTTTTWKLNTVNIRPTVPTRYITVRAVKATVGGYFESITFVDNFTIGNGVGVEPESRGFAIAPQPNPFTESFRFSLDASAKMPCSVTLTDMTGRVAASLQVSDRNARIDRSGLSAGVYLLSIRDASGVTSYSRIVAE
jgi:hypothetical protein